MSPRLAAGHAGVDAAMLVLAIWSAAANAVELDLRAPADPRISPLLIGVSALAVPFDAYSASSISVPEGEAFGTCPPVEEPGLPRAQRRMHGDAIELAPGTKRARDLRTPPA